MKEIRNNIIKRTVLWMSMFSVLLYSTRVCGITNLIAQAAEKDAPESDFVIEENDNIQNTSKKDNYIVVTDDSKTAKVIEKKYGEANTIGGKSKHNMQKESVAVCKMTGSQAQTLQERDDVLRVEKDSTMKANGKRHKREVVKIKQSKLKKEWNMAMIRRDVNDTVSTKDTRSACHTIQILLVMVLLWQVLLLLKKMEKVLQELIQMLNCIQQEYLMRIILHLQVVLLRPFIGQLTIM